MLLLLFLSAFIILTGCSQPKTFTVEPVLKVEDSSERGISFLPRNITNRSDYLHLRHRYGLFQPGQEVSGSLSLGSTYQFFYVNLGSIEVEANGLTAIGVRFWECDSRGRDIDLVIDDEIMLGTNAQTIIDNLGESCITIYNSKTKRKIYIVEGLFLVDFFLDTEEDVVIAIEIRHNFDNRDWGEQVSGEIPQRIINYLEPASMGTDDIIYRLEGDLYVHPAPVHAFLDNGWEIEETVFIADMNHAERIEMTRGEVSVIVDITNLEGHALPFKYYHVSSLTMEHSPIFSEDGSSVESECGRNVFFGQFTVTPARTTWEEVFAPAANPRLNLIEPLAWNYVLDFELMGIYENMSLTAFYHHERMLLESGILSEQEYERLNPNISYRKYQNDDIVIFIEIVPSFRRIHNISLEMVEPVTLDQ